MKLLNTCVHYLRILLLKKIVFIIIINSKIIKKNIFIGQLFLHAFFFFLVNKLFCRADNVVGSTKDTHVVSSLHTTTVTYPKQISAPHDLTTSTTTTSVNHHHHHHNNNSRVVVPINQNNSNSNNIRTTTSELHQTTTISIDLTERDRNYLSISQNNIVVDDDGIIIQSHTNNNNRSQQSSAMSSSGMMHHHHRPGPSSSSHTSHVDLRRNNGNSYNNGPPDRRMHMNNQDRHSVS